MKILHLSLVIIFIVFALIQYNDPDFYIWIPAYLAVAFLPLASFLGKPHPLFARILCAIILVWSITYIPALLEWIGDGMPTITKTMKAESPHIELIREVLGLFICLVVTFFYSRK